MTEALHHNPVSVFPRDLFERCEAETRERVWRIAHTKSRREKKLAAFLIRQNIGYYLPLVLRRQPGQKRVRHSLVPVFSGYVFFKADDYERYQAMCSSQIARVIEVPDQAGLIRELKHIKTVIDVEAHVYPHEYLEQGQKVRVVSGPFKGVEGLIDRKKGGNRLVLQVSSLFEAVAVDVGADMVEPMGRVF